MTLRLTACAATLAITGLFAVTAAILPCAPAVAEPGSWIEPPAKTPRLRPGDRNNLNFLFEALKVAPDEASSKSVEEKIWALWMISPSDTANLLMTRVKTAMDGEDLDLAIRLLDSVIEIKPDYAEAWNRRATAYYMKKDFARAMADIRQVLAREPRHFGAIAGLGMIMRDLGEDKFALDMFRRALAIHPRLPRIPGLVKDLAETVDGRDI
jgi:tetratricopeptide (TPR) repeat protein